MHTKEKDRIPVQPESVKVPPLVAQLTDAVPVYPEPQDTTQLAAVTCPEHPLEVYPVGIGMGRVQVFSLVVWEDTEIDLGVNIVCPCPAPCFRGESRFIVPRRPPRGKLGTDE